MASKGQTLTLPQAAALLGRSERFVGNLRERGYVATVKHGEYPLVNLVRGVIAYYDELEVKNAHTAREVAATDARTREIKLRIQRKSANLIGRADAEAELDDWAKAVRDEMGALRSIEFENPARQAEWQREIEASLARFDQLTADAKARLKTGDHK